MGYGLSSLRGFSGADDACPDLSGASEALGDGAGGSFVARLTICRPHQFTFSRPRRTRGDTKTVNSCHQPGGKGSADEPNGNLDVTGRTQLHPQGWGVLGVDPQNRSSRFPGQGTFFRKGFPDDAGDAGCRQRPSLDGVGEMQPLMIPRLMASTNASAW